MKNKKWYQYLDKIANVIEIAIAVMLLIVIALKAVEMAIHALGFPVIILELEFNAILALALNLVIGVEFVKMLYKHTPASVINVLLFATARLMIVGYENTIDILLGVIAISGLFAAKKFLIDNSPEEKKLCGEKVSPDTPVAENPVDKQV